MGQKSYCTRCETPITEIASMCPNCSKATGLDAGSPSGLGAVTEALGGRYEVVSLLGKGAFGEVYKAKDALLNRTVAIKRIRLDKMVDQGQLEEARQRFIREAQVVAQLQHPSIVTIYDVVATPETSYFIMEFVDGHTLHSRFTSQKALPADESVFIVSKIAEALHHAHEHKVVHRDVKPANILISRSGQVKVADFGIAKAESSQQLTTAGAILGTPDYMSPEQAKGSPVEYRSDLFSLGCILYECLSGKRPFPAKSVMEVLVRIVNTEPAPIDCESLGLPTEVQMVLDRALAKDLSKRFASGAEFAETLRSLPGLGSCEKLTVLNKTETRRPSGEVDAGSSGGSRSKPPDSVADSLMMEARQTTHIQPHLHAFKQEDRRLSLTGSPLLEFRNVTLTPEEAFILSRVDGNVMPRDILAISPLTEEETARALLGFLRSGLIAFEGGQPGEGKASRRAEVELRREIEKLHETLQQRDDWQVLGLAPGASFGDIKGAFQKKAFRYHPDRYPKDQDTAVEKKLSWIFNRVSEAFTNLSAQKGALPVQDRDFL